MTDAVGAPLAGPVDVSFGIYDVPSGGTPLYLENHLGVVLDANGAFSVLVGGGTPVAGSYDADLFAGMNRYLEVVVEGEMLAPRQPVAAVPYALVAENLATASNRFEACPVTSHEDDPGFSRA